MELPNAKYIVNRMESFFPNEIGKMQVQGEPLKSPPPKFAKYKIPL